VEGAAQKFDQGSGREAKVGPRLNPGGPRRTPRWDSRRTTVVVKPRLPRRPPDRQGTQTWDALTVAVAYQLTIGQG